MHFVVQKYPSHVTQALTWLSSLEEGPAAVVQASHIQSGVDSGSRGIFFWTTALLLLFTKWEELITEKNKSLHPNPARCALLCLWPQLKLRYCWRLFVSESAKWRNMRKKLAFPAAIDPCSSPGQVSGAGVWHGNMIKRFDERVVICYPRIFPQLGLQYKLTYYLCHRAEASYPFGTLGHLVGTWEASVTCVDTLTLNAFIGR